MITLEVGELHTSVTTAETLPREAGWASSGPRRTSEAVATRCICCSVNPLTLSPYSVEVVSSSSWWIVQYMAWFQRLVVLKIHEGQTKPSSVQNIESIFCLCDWAHYDLICDHFIYITDLDWLLLHIKCL